MDQFQQFAQGLQVAFTSPENYVTFGIFIIVAAIVYWIFRSFYNYYQNQRKQNQFIKYHDLVFQTPPRHIPPFNPVQRRVIHSLIQEFKKREIIAAAIPLSVLEHYSEYFYRNIEKLKIPDSVSNRIVLKIYPINPDSLVEIEIKAENRLYVFERKVLAVDSRSVVIQNIENVPFQLHRGTPLNISYTAGNDFLSGESSIVNLLPNNRTMLAYPKNIRISNERRYSRVPLRNISGNLVPVQHPEVNIGVMIKDIGPEGALLQTTSILKKNLVYRLSFIDLSLEETFQFDGFECVISQSFLAESGMYEYGMSFVYLDLSTQSRLLKYLNLLITNIR